MISVGFHRQVNSYISTSVYKSLLNVNYTSDTIPSCNTKMSGYFFIFISFSTVPFSIVKEIKGYTKYNRDKLKPKITMNKK